LHPPPFFLSTFHTPSRGFRRTQPTHTPPCALLCQGAFSKGRNDVMCEGNLPPSPLNLFRLALALSNHEVSFSNPAGAQHSVFACFFFFCMAHKSIFEPVRSAAEVPLRTFSLFSSPPPPRSYFRMVPFPLPQRSFFFFNGPQYDRFPNSDRVDSGRAVRLFFPPLTVIPGAERPFKTNFFGEKF